MQTKRGKDFYRGKKTTNALPQNTLKWQSVQVALQQHDAVIKKLKCSNEASNWNCLNKFATFLAGTSILSPARTMTIKASKSRLLRVKTTPKSTPIGGISNKKVQAYPHSVLIRPV